MNQLETMDITEKSSSADETLNPISPANEISQEEIAAPAHSDDSEEHGDASQQQHSYLEELNQELAKIPDAESKLQRVIDFMKLSLAQTGSPHFKSFWQARGLSLQLFKENIAPTVRTVLWAKYTELSKEARRLKELLDEQSAFAVEQIEIAIKALETEIDQYNLQDKQNLRHEFEVFSQSLKSQFAFYSATQHELDFLNKQAARINGLRKELIKTEMRVRKKNKFFQQLSQLGDKVFPKRKSLISDLSNKFIAGIDAFIKLHFSNEVVEDSLFFLREEIKALQGTAKLLTLNTHAFTHTRMRLSECWDKIKHVEKERKKMRNQQKSVFKENTDTVMQKITEFNTAMQGSEISPVEGNKKIDEIVEFMRTVELGRDDLRYLREQITIARKPLLDMMKSDEQKRQEQEQERQRQKKQVLVDLKHEIDQLLRSTDIHDAIQLTAKRDELLEKIQSAAIIKAEKLELERQLKPLRDIIADKKAMSLTALSPDDRQALQQLKDVLQERRALRQEIKDQLESLRKSAGSSALDFQRAMEFNSQMHSQKERLEKISQSIQEVEKQISDLEKKSS